MPSPGALNQLPAQLKFPTRKSSAASSAGGFFAGAAGALASAAAGFAAGLSSACAKGEKARTATGAATRKRVFIVVSPLIEPGGRVILHRRGGGHNSAS